ncbi:hypothetical protein SAMN05444401_3527 [Clostridium amylolyticum]|uniref:Uncharacterized protein n=1 Tax=Clostridium amylolyticum TaxID=1121298 RepID=A0A1M6KX99_9CLOT|nr:hypothetical protein SAMN05444401_3527 [Clostridium amylolyticum]
MRKDNISEKNEILWLEEELYENLNKVINKEQPK